jgi:hypothetical protein
VSVDWVSVGEVLKVLGPIATAGAAWFAANVARRGLNRWQAETIGKRKAELAEEVLADFYRVPLIFEWVRSKGGFGGEGETRKAMPGETSDETRYRNAIYVPIERLSKENEFFGQMSARRFRFKALFDTDKPFADLAAIQNEIIVAARMLIITYRDAPIQEPPQKAEWETTIGWGFAEKDPIDLRLKDIVAEAERLCRPYLI